MVECLILKPAQLLYSAIVICASLRAQGGIGGFSRGGTGDRCFASCMAGSEYFREACFLGDRARRRRRALM